MSLFLCYDDFIQNTVARERMLFVDFQEKRGIAYCGLACVLCSDTDCPGCASVISNGGGCPAGKCAAGKSLDGCYACTAYDSCTENMLHGKRNQAFNRYAKAFGKQALIDRLHINFENGIAYHTPGKFSGDYDRLETEDEIYQLLRYGQVDPYTNCPVYANEHFLLRLVSMDDAQALLPCYRQPTKSVTANSFNCTYGYGSQTIEEMRDFINLWLEAYRDRGFVRWSVLDNRTNAAIGTIELFNRQGEDYFDNCGILRLDLSKKYECATKISEILSLLLTDAFVLFNCTMIATIISPIAKERLMALSELGFHPIDEQTVRGDGFDYDSFWILER